jgi:hypothetical protein
MPKKVENYEVERKQVLQKMLDILGITDTNKMFSLKELDANEQKQNDILALEPDIKKYFFYSNWTCFKKPCKRRYLSFIKYVMKDMNINLKAATLTTRFDDLSSQSETYYKIL